MSGSGRDWRSVLLAAGAFGGSALALSISMLMLIGAAVKAVRNDSSAGAFEPLQAVVLASAFLLVSLVFLPAAYYSVRRLQGGTVLTSQPGPLKVWEGVLLLPIWVGAAFLAQFLTGQSIGRWFTPPLYLLCVVIPVLFLVRLAVGGIQAGSNQRSWGALAAGMAVGTTLSIAAEGILVLLGLLGIGLYLAFHPELLIPFRQLAGQLTKTSDSEHALELLLPFLKNPLIFALALLFFSGFTPLIEETAKSIPAWLIFGRLSSPAQGFVVGALSGAGFGLLESLLASASPDSNWASTLLVRGASTMMHIMAGSLTGWGIASFRTAQDKRLGYLFGSYAAALGLHAVWNASVVALAFGALHGGTFSGSPDVLGYVLMFLGGSILLGLCILIPVVLGMANWNFRRHAPSDSAA